MWRSEFSGVAKITQEMKEAPEDRNAQNIL